MADKTPPAAQPRVDEQLLLQLGVDKGTARALADLPRRVKELEARVKELEAKNP